MLKPLLAGLAATLALCTLGAPPPAQAEPVRTGHLTAELAAAAGGVTPGGEVRIVLRQVIDEGWHTYWRNSGDSGAPTELTWTLPAGWRVGEMVWAPPSRKPIGPLMNYGYSGEVLLPVTVRAPASARPGETVTLRAQAAFLVCSDVCVPEDADLSVAVKVVADAPAPDPVWGPRVDAALAAAPRPGLVEAVLVSGPSGPRIAATGAVLAGGKARDAYFFPYAAGVLDHAAPQPLDRGPEGLTLALKLAPGAAAPSALAGVLAVDGKVYEIEAKPGQAPPGAAGLGPPPSPGPATAATAGGLAGAILFAFLGGLILNLMPCVFPVLAMKAASLAGHGHDRRAARLQGLTFLAGVMATFLGLAALLLIVRAGGAAVGWGFQLQSPPVVSALALLMLVVGLNLSGLFEIGASLQGIGAGAAARSGGLGAFLTGALAVVVAAPCTAPFMAPALGWAMTQPPAASLAVFAGLGLGFGAPFTLAALAPGLLSRLPRPGPWMETFRRVLAFPMYGAAGWLAWVLAVQAGPDLLARLLAAAVALAFACWLAGLAQARALQGRPARAQGVAALVVAVLAVAGAVWPGAGVAEPSGPAGSGESGGLAYEAYSPERLAALRAEGKAVFVNYTAAWCVTCQVNERVAFSTRAAAEAFESSGTVYLKADWTRRDGVIAADLARFGRAGVPLYLVYPANGGEPKILPQLLTPDIVARAVQDAARG